MNANKHYFQLLSKNPIHMVDIGASGGSSKRWRQLGDSCQFTFFEPDARAYQALAARKKTMKPFIIRHWVSQKASKPCIYAGNKKSPRFISLTNPT
jgi:hypothetical protein